MEITTMLNINSKLVLFALCGASLAAASTASQASNVYNAARSQADEASATQPYYWACPTEYWACPTEPLPIFAQTHDPNVRTDATVSDVPEQSTWSLEDERRYYDYSRLIMGD
jgi:hypothetical protein